MMMAEDLQRPPRRRRRRSRWPRLAWCRPSSSSSSRSQPPATFLCLLLVVVFSFPHPTHASLSATVGAGAQHEQYFLNFVFLSNASRTSGGGLLSSLNNLTTAVSNVVYANGHLYIGAENWLLKMNAKSLEIEQAVQYGPNLDSPMCRYTPVQECSFQASSSTTATTTGRSMMSNYNKLLIYYDKRNAILSCWSARQGTCDLRDADTLELVQNSTQPVVANDASNSTIGFIASAPNSQDLFYVASTYTNQGPYRYEVPALAGRSLHVTNSPAAGTGYSSPLSGASSSSGNKNNGFMSVLTYSQGLKTSKASIEFMSRFQKSFIVKYVNAFNHGIYNYFLNVQHADTEANARGDFLQTKLGRLCLNDLSFTKSYVEIPLRCTSKSGGSISSLRSIEYNELLSARLVQIRTKSVLSSASDEYGTSGSKTTVNSAASADSYYIVGLFQQTTRSNFNASLDGGGQSSSTKQAVCTFALKHVQAKIKENLVKCYDSSGSGARNSNYDNAVMRGLNFIKPDQQCNSHYRRPGAGFQSRSQPTSYDSPAWSSSSSSSVGDDFCSSADNELYPIGGQIAATANAVLEFDTSSSSTADLSFDSLQLWSDPVATTLLLMSHKRQLVKFYHIKSLTGNSVNAVTNYRNIRLPAAPTTGLPAPAPPLTSMVFEQQQSQDGGGGDKISSPPNLFVVGRNYVQKIKMSACDAFKTCNECLVNSMTSRSAEENSDPYCGWCSSTSQCTTQAQCQKDGVEAASSSTSRSSNKWLHGSSIEMNSTYGGASVASLFDSMCVDIESVQPAEIYKENAHHEWIEINFRKELTTTDQSGQSSLLLKNQTSSVYQCVFVAPDQRTSSSSKQPLPPPQAVTSIKMKNNELRTDAIQVSLNKLKCPLPHASKLQHLFLRNDGISGPSAGARLVTSEDGLFKMPSNSAVYFYEAHFNQLSLQIYVENLVTTVSSSSSDAAKSATTVRRYGYIKPENTADQSTDSSSSATTMFNVTIVDCSVHKSCISCTMSSTSSMSATAPSCMWCDNKCVHYSSSSSSTDKCLHLLPQESIPASAENSTSSSSVTTACPLFDTGTSKLLIPYTAQRQQAPITFNMANMDLTWNSSDSSSSYTCMLTMFNGRFVGVNLTVPFVYVNRTHAQCSLNSVFADLEPFLSGGGDDKRLVKRQDDEENTKLENFDQHESIGDDQHDDQRGQVQTNLRIYDAKNDIFIDSVTNGRLALLFYKCELKALTNECGQCLALNRQLSCMWCQSGQPGQSGQSTCRFMNTQSKQAQALQCISSSTGGNSALYNQCDKPQILSIQPSKLAMREETVLTIGGINMGKRLEDVVAVNLLCGGGGGDDDQEDKPAGQSGQLVVTCDLIPSKYVPSKQITCRTRPLRDDRPMTAPGPLVCRLSLKLQNKFFLSEEATALATLAPASNILIVTSSQLITYVSPVLSEIQPAMIIQSANFVWLTLRGSDLDAGRSRHVYIHDDENGNGLGSGSDYENTRTAAAAAHFIRCEIKNYTSAEIKCRLNDKFKTLGKKSVRLYLDDGTAASPASETLVARAPTASLSTLRVTADPLIKSIDKHVTMYAGGTRFTLHGYNFQAVQSVYTYITFRDLWYSEPLQARYRVSNEQIVFDFPSLNDAFFQLVKLSPEYGGGGGGNSTTRYELMIGFIMDGFNVTLKNTPITYVPNFSDDLISIRETLIVKGGAAGNTSTADSTYSMVLDLNVDESVLPFIGRAQYKGHANGPFHHDLQIYVACSLCAKPVWSANNSRVHCQLPSLIANEQQQETNPVECEPKVFNALFAELKKHNKLALVNVFIGNYHVQSLSLKKGGDLVQMDENLSLFLKMFILNNVDNFLSTANQLGNKLKYSLMTTSESELSLHNRTVDALLQARHGKSLLDQMDATFTFTGVGKAAQESSFSLSAKSSATAFIQNLLFVATVVISALIVVGLLVIFAAKYVYKRKQQKRSLCSAGSSSGCDSGASSSGSGGRSGFHFNKSPIDAALFSHDMFMNDSTIKRSNKLFVMSKTGGGGSTSFTPFKRNMTGKHASSSIRSKKTTKQLMAEYEQIRAFIESVESANRHHSNSELEQLFQNYINELDQDLIYSTNSANSVNTMARSPKMLSLNSIFNSYKQYLNSFLFPANSSVCSWPASFGNRHNAMNGLLAIDMSATGMGQCSTGSGGTSGSSVNEEPTSSSGNAARSMIHHHHHHQQQQMMTQSSLSNSTTNTFLSLSNPLAQHASVLQQQQQTYATIKSSSQLEQQSQFAGTKTTAHNVHVLEAMQLFDQLMHNKTFLLTFIQVCEQSNSNNNNNKSPLFTLKDRMHFASLMTLALKDNLPYLYSIVKALLADYISAACTRDSSQKAKLLFRANESLVEPLLVNWLALFMHDYHLNTPQTSLSFFRLVKVARAYLDMGPCDEQTQQATNTLNEERLFKQFAALPAYNAVCVNVINCLNLPQTSNMATMMFTIRLLDCDSIKQAKEKIIDYLLYKLTLILNRNTLDKTIPLLNPSDVDLELCLTMMNAQQQQSDGFKTLGTLTTTVFMKECDEELADLAEARRLHTLKDYNVVNGSCINLTLKYHLRHQQQHASHMEQQQQQQQQAHEDANQHIYMSTLSMSNEYLLYAPSTIARGSQQQQQPQPPPLPPTLPPLNSTSQLKRPLMGTLPNNASTKSYHLLKPDSSGKDGGRSSSSASSTSASLTKTSNDGLLPSVVLDMASHHQSGKAASKKAKKGKKSSNNKQIQSAAASANTGIIARLLLTKSTLKPFINDLFESMFDKASINQLPPVIPHLFEFLDQEALKCCGPMSDQVKKTTRLWKTNIFLLRYWINILKNPHYLFSGTSSVSMDKSVLTDSTMTCIAQLLLDSCSQDDPYNLYDTHSPINRLLFINEVPRYREIINQYFDTLENRSSSESTKASSANTMPGHSHQQQSISDHELHFYLNEFSKLKQHSPAILTTQMTTGLIEDASQSSEPNQIDILLQLYEYYEKYEQTINANLGQQQCSILLPVHHRLVQIKDLMMTSSTSTSISPPPSATLNAGAGTPTPVAAAMHPSFANTLARNSGGQAFMLSFANSSFPNQQFQRFQPAQQQQQQQQQLYTPDSSAGVACYAATMPLQEFE